MQLKRRKLWAKLDHVRKLRNTVDQLDQKAVALAQTLPDNVATAFRRLPQVPGGCDPRQALQVLQPHLAEGKGLLERLRLFLRRSKDIAVVSYIADRIIEHPELFGSAPSVPVTLAHFSVWLEYLEDTQRRLDYYRTLARYYRAFRELCACPTTADFANELSSLESTLWEWGRRYIAAKGKTAPDRFEPRTRRALGEYSAAIQKLASGEVGRKLYASLMRQQKNLFHEVSKAIPAWCISNLSANGSIPFESTIFDLLIVDEASQCDIASALPLLYRSRRALIIGDPNQLRHIPGVHEEVDNRLLERHDLVHTSDMRYCYRNQSLYDLAAASARPGDTVDLREHFRSHAHIVEFSNQKWYGGRLRVATDYRKLKRSPNVAYGVRWTDVRGSVRKVSGRGAFNKAEAETVVSELHSLLVDR